MILANGIIYESNKQEEILKNLESRINEVLRKPLLKTELVIEACHRLSEKIKAGDYAKEIAAFDLEHIVKQEQVEEVIQLLQRDNLMAKVSIELGTVIGQDIECATYRQTFNKKLYPLGVLFHIAAGNIDGLPVYSVVEGLLAGNINIVKLPAVDNGISVFLLTELIQQEPSLADYIYVFDTPSSDINALKQMANLADGIVIWGGDEAVKAARSLAAPNTKIIEWGHKLSFAYITERAINIEKLRELARHMIETKQLLCSSCQGIFLETQSEGKIDEFCKSFVQILDEIAEDYPKLDIGMKAQLTLQLYCMEMDSLRSGTKLYRGKYCSIISKKDSQLESSLMYGNCWIKPMNRNALIDNLRGYKGYLQTVGLLCCEEEKEELSSCLFRAGAVKITDLGQMSVTRVGEAHDGEYPLMRYSKVVEIHGGQK